MCASKAVSGARAILRQRAQDSGAELAAAFAKTRAKSGQAVAALDASGRVVIADEVASLFLGVPSRVPVLDPTGRWQPSLNLGRLARFAVKQARLDETWVGTTQIMLELSSEPCRITNAPRIADVEQMTQIARRSQDPEAGTVRLGLFPTLGPYLLPHVVPNLRRRFPRLELLLVEEKTDQILARLRDGRLDAGLLALPIHDDQLHVEPLFDEPFLLAVPQQHAFAKHGALAVEDLDDQHLLLLEEGHCLRDQALDVCRLAGADERDGFRATSLETLRQMVAAGVGMTLLPVLAVQPPVPASPDIRLLPFRGEAPHREIAMVWRRSSAMGEFLKQLAAELRALPKALLKPPMPAAARARRGSTKP